VWQLRVGRHKLLTTAMRDPLKSNTCAVYLRAVAEPDRLRIIQCLRSGPKSVGEIAAYLKTALANTSHHLRFLHSARLVKTAKRGRHVMYSLAPEFARGRAGAPAGGSLDVLDFGCCRIELTQK
jgi:ArsR family transcriptional regulator, nickel/cobalt-responsive transcriptional repressor